MLNCSHSGCVNGWTGHVKHGKLRCGQSGPADNGMLMCGVLVVLKVGVDVLMTGRLGAVVLMVELYVSMMGCWCVVVPVVSTVGKLINR